MSLVYWDTLLLIYWFEEHPQYADPIRHILKRMEQRKDDLCTSSFALAETLVGPLQKRGARRGRSHTGGVTAAVRSTSAFYKRRCGPVRENSCRTPGFGRRRHPPGLC